MSLIASNLSLTDLDSRARHVFRDIVETYLETGLPVGSRRLSLSGGLNLSPASIRNTMAELTRYGLLAAPHVSAGRIPTQIGLRLFVDGLLEIGDISSVERNSIQTRLKAGGYDNEQIFEQASTLLAGLAGGAGLVLAPQEEQDSTELKHVEFINLDMDQALVVLVYMDGRVENRLMRRPEGLLPASLERAGNFLSARLKGQKLEGAREAILAEIEAGKVEIDKAAQNLIKQGLASWGGEERSRQYIKRSLIAVSYTHLTLPTKA